MVKLCCDRCGEEIKDVYYTISIGEYEVEPKPCNAFDSLGKALDSYSSTRDSLLHTLNSFPMYCGSCKDKIVRFIERTSNFVEYPIKEV